MDKQQLYTLFANPFNYSRFVTFCEEVLGIPKGKLSDSPSNGTPIVYDHDKDKNDVIDANLVATVERNGWRIGILIYKLSKKTTITRTIGLRKLVDPFVETLFMFDAAIAVFQIEDKVEWRLSFIADLPKDERRHNNARRYTYVFGHPNELYRTPIENFLALQKKPYSEKGYATYQEAFSVEALSKTFYDELYTWYLWALSPEVGVTFPNLVGTSEDDRENLNVKIIRLITRLLFIWFIRKKNFVPGVLFDKTQLADILKDFSADATDDGCYYNAILQNLFFGTLNHEVEESETHERRHFATRKERDLRNLYRYAEMFKISQEEVVALFEQIPFLNGGLFECLDKFAKMDLCCETDCYADGFSRNATKLNGHFKYRAFVPNVLFFGKEQVRTFSLQEGGKFKGPVPGLFTLFDRYNFTIEENSPNDEQVALDPELLGRVFENLLASYNEETRTSARKASGAFYTPRNIVQYMVDEALFAYLDANRPASVTHDELRDFVNRNVVPAESWGVTTRQALAETLLHVRIIDPACGSGAFPVSCLTRLVDLILTLTPEQDRFALKRRLLNDCIFGVDIQPIAMLICRLRCFISLICDQPDLDLTKPAENYGIDPLPNLETRFVAANTLVSSKLSKLENAVSGESELGIVLTSELEPLFNRLRLIRESHLSAKTPSKKKKLRDEDRELCDRIRARAKEIFLEHASDKLVLLRAERAQLQERLSGNDETLFVKEVASQDSFGFAEIREQTTFADTKGNIQARLRKLDQAIASEEQRAEFLHGRPLEQSITEFTGWTPYDQNASSPFFDPKAMFVMDGGFDIVIGNPPYISTKGVTARDAEKYTEEFGFSDDTYNLFFLKGSSMLRPNGILSYITPKTYWTTQTKQTLREHILSKRLLYIFDTASPFAAMVDTCITSFQNAPHAPTHTFAFLDGRVDLANPCTYQARQHDYEKVLESIFFMPTASNMKLFAKYGKVVKELHDTWWSAIKTSRDIEKNRARLKAYHDTLKPGDIALLGCLADGGVGLQTGDNGRYIAVRKSSKWASKIREDRLKKLKELVKTQKVSSEELDGRTPESFLQQASEAEIADTFDAIKRKHGLRCFGKGFLYRLIDDSEIADVDTLTRDERENGIDPSKPFYVPYDKGDKDGNRWYLETPYAIAWSKENVHYLKTDPAARYQGYAFFFKEGFCWNNVSIDIRCRLKQKTVQSTEAMSFFAMSEKVPAPFLVAVMNSQVVGQWVNNFINVTVHCTTGDAKLIPIVIPTSAQLAQIVDTVNRIVTLKASSSSCDSIKISALEEKCEQLVRGLYVADEKVADRHKDE